MSQQFTREEVAKFDGKSGNKAYLIVNGDVLDVTMFAGGHPGGELAILDHAGKDATQAFYALHRHEVLEKRLQRLKVGEVKGYTRGGPDDPQPWRELSQVPYAELDMENSPYFNDSHKRFRIAVRQWFWDEGVYAWTDAAEDSGELPPRDLFQKYGKAGLMALFAGKHTLPFVEDTPDRIWVKAGIKKEELDLFHILILQFEHTRMGSPGAEECIKSGINIGFTPLLLAGQEWTKGKVCKDILEGNKVICLAVTEPGAGSDVSGVQTTATQCTRNGEPGFIVRGTKKWITSSRFADYYTTLVRTKSEDGKDLGHSMLLVEKQDDVVIRAIPTDYSPSAGTGLISYEDVFVPQRNLLGKVGEGFKITMHNFNLERWNIVTFVVGRSQRVIEECLLWANQRKAFGKKLTEQNVIRQHLGMMIAQHQAVVSYLLAITMQYNTLSHEEANKKLAGPTALLKYQATRMSHDVSDKAVQIFGGRGVTKTGMGKTVERNQRSFKLASVYGGSEEIMADLGVRQVLKSFPKGAKL